MKQLRSDKVTDFVPKKRAPGTKAKTPIRIAIEALSPGDALVLDRGTDYESYRQVYFILRDVRKKSLLEYTQEESADEQKILISCVN